MASLKTCDPTSDKSEQIIATSAEVTPNGGLLKFPQITLPPWKLTYPLKNDGWKMYFLLK